MQTVLQNARLAAFDFDNTLADTFTPGPSGIGVNEAYERSLAVMFKTRGLLEEVGGLKNRAPTELIHDILRTRPKLRVIGESTYESNRDRLMHLMPRGKGICLDPIQGGNHMELFGEFLVRLRLEMLLPEIGPSWPRPFDGALQLLEDLRRGGKFVAIISSGHDLFIRKCFKVWGADCPHLILSDDDLRPMKGPLEHRMKPSKMLFTHLLRMARESDILVDESDVIYFGDDPRKDGELARNANVPFILFRPPSGASGPADVTVPCVSCWHEVRGWLH